MLEKYEQRISKLCIKAVNSNNMHQSTKRSQYNYSQYPCGGSCGTWQLLLPCSGTVHVCSSVGLTERLYQLLLEHVVNTVGTGSYMTGSKVQVYLLPS